MKISCLLVGALLCGVGARAEVAVNVERNSSGSPAFKFSKIPSPSRTDAAMGGKFTISEGTADQNGAGLEALNDGKLPAEEDQPSRNFFFNAGSEGGKLQLDLGKIVPVKQINSYSWHTDARAPQVYVVYGKKGENWEKIAAVDTTAKGPGGQVGVSIENAGGILGEFQFLRFDVAATEKGNMFAQTFFSEIDVIDRDAPVVAENAAGEKAEEIKRSINFASNGVDYTFTVDASGAPDLADWAEKNLLKVSKEWYPKLVEMLPSEGYQAPTNVTLRFRDNMGGTPASAGGNGINLNTTWYRNNLQGEAVGAVVHEMVHVVQNWGRARRNNPNATRAPGWLQEGIPDYIRWFLYEPESRGADITARNLSRAKYDASYRVTGNFINYVTLKYDKDVTRKLNAAAREGKYTDDLWKEYTGKTLAELGDEWVETNKARLAKAAELTKLSDEEKAAGWKYIFNAADLTGWSNFKSNKIKTGWQVKDGVLICEDPHNASDLCTREEFGWFELELEYNISHAGNSGIIFHVSKEGGATWASGPEFQLEDNAAAADPQRCGWLYALYQPPVDPATGKPLDATKPPGEWNKVRLVVGPDKCEHYINGVKYFEYNLDSDDFKARVAKSKFGKMPLFAKVHKGALALQGDHGQVSFRNIKVRPIEAKN